jgi:hypothetical protein
MFFGKSVKGRDRGPSGSIGVPFIWRGWGKPQQALVNLSARLRFEPGNIRKRIKSSTHMIAIFIEGFCENIDESFVQL